MESSSNAIIMSVIRILSNSKDDVERDVIRKKLEDFLADSDKKLTKLVAEHHKDLRSVMQIFYQTAEKLQSSLAKLNKAKEHLNNSRSMLTSKLDELKKVSDDLKRSERLVQLLDQEDNLADLENHVNTMEINDEDDSDFSTTLLENNVFNPRASENSTPSLFRFSKSSYAICFEEHFKELPLQ